MDNGIDNGIVYAVSVVGYCKYNKLFQEDIKTRPAKTSTSSICISHQSLVPL